MLNQQSLCEKFTTALGQVCNHTALLVGNELDKIPSILAFTLQIPQEYVDNLMELWILQYTPGTIQCVITMNRVDSPLMESYREDLHEDEVHWEIETTTFLYQNTVIDPQLNYMSSGWSEGPNILEILTESVLQNSATPVFSGPISEAKPKIDPREK